MVQALAHRGTSYDVISKLHRFGGIEFCISSGRAGIEMGHIHGNHIADLPFPLQIRNELINSGHDGLVIGLDEEKKQKKKK